jgi:hypothetical protein
MGQHTGNRAVRQVGLLLLAGVALLAWYSCSSDGITSPRENPPSTPATDEPAFAMAGMRDGIMFGSMNLPNAQISSVHTGAWRPVTPSTLLPELSGARAKGARLIVKLVPGDRQLRNADGSFSFEKWKSMVDRYKRLDFHSYIADGTLVGHYMIDEPHRSSRWKGGISQATVEAMARYSKQLWPDMVTFVRVVPSWLAQAPVQYRYLDAAYAQYASRRGDPARWLAGEVTFAKRLGLGLVLSMNVLDGGSKTSGIQGLSSGKFAMSATELRRNGTALLNESYGCAFIMYRYDATYYNRSDIRPVMADLSQLAKGHLPTSCRQ